MLKVKKDCKVLFSKSYLSQQVVTTTVTPSFVIFPGFGARLDIRLSFSSIIFSFLAIAFF